MAPLDMKYNPMDVAWGRSRRTPYVATSPPAPPATPAGPQPGGSNMIGGGSVTATGSGPFDANYRQNLAVQTGGQWARPNGNLSFDPTGPLNFGTPSGGGNAPNFGLPPTLLSVMGPQPGTPVNPPAAPAPAPAPAQPKREPSAWLADFLGTPGSPAWNWWTSLQG